MTKISAYLEEHRAEFKPWLLDNEQGRVELKVLPYLEQIEEGVFVEAGALDGLFMSNTKILEDLGWKGLLIEPSPSAYKKCKKNRKCFVENYALVGFDYKDKLVRGDFLHDGRKGLGARASIKSEGEASDTIAVKASTLGALLDKYKCTKVDFLSLDVEGYEMQVLKGIDFSKINIAFILLEVNSFAYSLEGAEVYLAQFGYKNLGCLSNFRTNNTPGWDGSHNDYLFEKKV